MSLTNLHKNQNKNGKMLLRQKIVLKSICILSTIIIIVIIFSRNDEDFTGEYRDAFIAAIKVEEVEDQEIKTQQLVNLTDFRYLLENKLCGSSDEQVLGVILVTSYVGHDELRAAHRKAISQAKLKEMGFIRVFLLAAIPAREKFITQSQIEDENNKFGDLLQGHFLEAYRNLTYKHLMGLRWAALECQRAKFVVKMDDDIVFDPFRMRSYLEGLQSSEGDFFAGYVLDQQAVIRLTANKWFVSREEYAADVYPDYLSGWLYVAKPATAAKIVIESQTSNFFWIDDTFVTGILRDKLKIPLLRLNEWFSSNSQFMECCIRDSKAFGYECQYSVGPNGGDARLIVDFMREAEKCFAGKCGKRPAGKLLKQTCVGEAKDLLQDHGEAVVRAVDLG